MALKHFEGKPKPAATVLFDVLELIVGESLP